MNDKIKCDCQLLVEGFDWGPSITCIILKSDKFVKVDPIDPDLFKVSIKKQNVFHEITLKSAKISDGEIWLYPQSHPTFGFLSPMTYSHQTNRNQFLESTEISVEIKKNIKIKGGTISGFEMPMQGDYLIPSVDKFSHEKYHFDRQIVMRYSLYEPEEKTNMPLVIWLHGAGEGGIDNRVLLLGNPVTRLIEPNVQNIFGGACILVPQCPTFWMDDGHGVYTKNGLSIYHKALRGLIEKVVFKNKKIDKQRIYLGGCSNGGYMVINMLLHYPEYFAAAFPVCEAYYDKWLQDADIQLLKQIPLWFTHALDDQIVAIENFTKATYNRLIFAGGRDIHLSAFDNVVDYSSIYCGAEGKPYIYNSHWSWIYSLNNQCKEMINNTETSMFEWLFAHRKSF